MRSTKKSLFGSKRPRIFREPKKRSPSLFYKRKQRVKFRPRYAGSVVKKMGKSFALLTLGAGAMLAIGWTTVKGAQYWKQSERLRVKQVVFSGELPASLKGSFKVGAHDHLLKIHPLLLEKESLEKFPELKRISIRRTLDRSLIVNGTFRRPIAKLESPGKELGIDNDGIVFALGELLDLPANLPVIECAYPSDRTTVLGILDRWQKDVPNFYSLVKKVETDRMRELYVELTDGVTIEWGNISDANIVQQSQRVLTLREKFTPQKTPAKLILVTTDRIVMDANWKSKN